MSFLSWRRLAVWLLRRDRSLVRLLECAHEPLAPEAFVDIFWARCLDCGFFRLCRDEEEQREFLCPNRDI